MFTKYEGHNFARALLNFWLHWTPLNQLLSTQLTIYFSSTALFLFPGSCSCRLNSSKQCFESSICCWFPEWQFQCKTVNWIYVLSITNSIYDRTEQCYRLFDVFFNNCRNLTMWVLVCFTIFTIPIYILVHFSFAKKGVTKYIIVFQFTELAFLGEQFWVWILVLKWSCLDEITAHRKFLCWIYLLIFVLGKLY